MLKQTIIIFLVVLVFTGPSHGKDNDKKILDANSAAELIKQRTNGKVLSVTPSRQNGQASFRVKVLHDDGKIKIYRLNASDNKR